jgi:hypothetical protein
LWVGALRLSSNRDIQNLVTAVGKNISLVQIHLYNIRLQVAGNYRLDERGMVWFIENEEKECMEKLDVNPLLDAISALPNMKKIQLDLQLKPAKMVGIQEETLRALCRPGRTFLMLGSCDLDDDDITIVAEELQKNTSCLEILNLCRNNQITEVGWRILAEMLETNYNLTGLFTPSCRNGPDQLLDTNYGIASRYAPIEPATPPSTPCRAKMDLLLRLNEKGRKRLLRDPSTTRTDWVDFLVSEIDDIDMCFLLLLRGAYR